MMLKYRMTYDALYHIYGIIVSIYLVINLLTGDWKKWLRKESEITISSYFQILRLWIILGWVRLVKG